jgi:Fe2+ or Zn2+ uptake regulation protein
LKKQDLKQATTDEIISQTTFAGRSWVYANLNVLTEKGFLEKTRIEDETGYSKNKLDSYISTGQVKIKLPYWVDLE